MKSFLKHMARDWWWLIGIALFLVIVLIVLYFITATEWKNVRLPVDETTFPQEADFAWDGTAFGAVWSASGQNNGTSEVFFTRVRPDGSLIVPVTKVSDKPEKISTEANMVWTGREYGIVWVERIPPSDEYRGDCDLYFARMDTEGSMVGDRVIVERGRNTCISNPSMVWTGTEYGIAWNEHENIGDMVINRLYVIRLDADGNRLRLGGVGSGLSVEPSITWNGSSYGVVWADRNPLGEFGLWFARLNAEGLQEGEDVALFDGLAWRPRIASSGSTFGVVWTAFRDDVQQIHFASLNQDGSLRGEVKLLTANEGDERSIQAMITGSRSGFGTVWYDPEYTVVFKEVDVDGNELAPARRINDPRPRYSGRFPGITTINDTEYAVNWDEFDVQGGDIYFAVSRVCSWANVWEWLKGRVL